MEMCILYALQSLRGPALNRLMILFSNLGRAGFIWLLSAAACLKSSKWRRCGAAIGVSLLTSLIFGNLILKNLFRRKRPCWKKSDVELLVPNPSDYSFPSCHTFSSFAAATSIFLHSKKAGVPAFLLASCISFSRLYLFVHYPTDIIAGTLLGITSGFTSRKAVNKITRKRRGRLKP